MRKYVAGLVVFWAAWSAKAQPLLPGQDCFRALNVCQTSYSSNLFLPGTGVVNDIGLNTTCIPSGEQNSNWFQFNVIAGGTFTFNIVPNNPNDDFDFLLYNLSNDSCAGIANNTLAPVRCNFSSTPGNTGLNAASTTTNSAASGPPHSSQLTVQPGEVYVLMVNNFTASETGYTLNLGGSATMVDNVNPMPESVLWGNTCNPRNLRLMLTETILCSTLSGDLSEISITGPSAVTITSVVGNGCNNSNQTNRINIGLSSPIMVPGIYTLTIQNGTDGNTMGDGCNNYIPTGTTITFEVLFQGPTIALNQAQNSTCTGATGSIDVTVSGGTQPYSFSWNTSPPQTTEDISNLASGSYTLTVTDANACVVTYTRNITQLNAPTISVTNNTPVSCHGLSDGSATISVSGGTPPYSYAWNTTPLQIGATATNLSAGTRQVVVTDAAGCSRTQNITISQPQPFTITSTFTYTDCGTAIGTATAVGYGGTTPYGFVWNTTPTQYGPAATNLAAGVYTVTGFDANNCMATENVSIQSNSNMGAAIVNVRHTCDEPSGQATAVTNNQSPPYTYLWNTTPPQTSATAVGLPEGNFFVVITDVNGCTQVLNIKIDTLADPITNVVALTQASCGGSDAMIEVAGTQGQAPFTYQWLSVPFGTNPVLSGLPFGFYTVVVTDALTCDDTLTIEVEEFVGEADFVWDEACYGLPTTFTAIVNTPVDSFEWDFGVPQLGAINNDTGQTVQFTYPLIDSYTIQLIANGRCIHDTITKTFSITQVPVPDFETLKEVAYSNSEVYFVYTGSPVVDYQWDFGNGLNSNLSFPATYYRDSGTYSVTLIATDSLGCSDTISRDISIVKEPLVFLPNAFTPKTGNLNDYYRLHGFGVEEISFQIFNRWGETIYQSTDFQELSTKGWDGRFADQDMPQGVYGYRLEVNFTNQRKVRRNGTITLIR